MIDLQDQHSLTVKTRCKCPKCGKFHNLRIDWTGLTIPQIFCRKCKGIITKGDYIGSMDEYTGVVL